MTVRVGFLTSHPIQYQVPVFRWLAARSGFDFTVLFAHLPDARQQGAGFGVPFEWDVPLLEGYDYEVLRNVAPAPSVTSFRGCDTPDVYDEIRRRRLDALVVNGWVVKSCLQGLWACRRLGIPCLVRGEANLRRPRAWWKRLAHRQLMHQYAACLYIGQANRDYYRQHGVPEARLFAAPYCVDNELFAAAARQIERAMARQRFGLDVEACVFVFCGKLEPKKHPLELLTAFRRFRDAGCDGQLLIVGDGPLRSACRQRVEELGLKESVKLAGFLNQSEIVAAYVACDCLVLPSDHGETWGLVVNEAMACGRPAVVSDEAGCAPDLIVEEQTGRTFSSGNWPELTERLLWLAADRERLKTMGDAARRQVDAYSPAAAGAGIVEAIRAVVSGDSREDDKLRQTASLLRASREQEATA